MADTPDPRPHHDVFLCYKSEDEAIALELRTELVNRGKDVFLDIISGADWAPLSASIQEALARSRTLVALITENFPISPHCREELHVALLAAKHLDGDTARVMAIARGVDVEKVRPKELSAQRLPFGGLPPAALVDSIVANVDAHTGWFGDAPTDMPIVTWYPRELPTERFFRGRYAELWDLHSGLAGRQRNRDRGLPVVSVTGAGGQGKTSLCLQYARVFARDHPGGVFVLDFGGSDERGVDSSRRAVRRRFREHMIEIARCLKVTGPDDVAGALEQRDLPYLWILDDLPSAARPEDIVALCAPTAAGRTVVTTRNPERYASATVEVGELDPDSCAELLTAYRDARPAERGAVRRIVALLGAHPLGLTITAGLTTSADFDGYEGLLDKLSSFEPDELDIARFEGDLPAGCSIPFSSIVLRSFRSLDSVGQAVLIGAGVLAAAPIPRRLLADIFAAETGGEDRDYAAGIASAVRRGLLDAEGSELRMHSLVARAIRSEVWSPALRLRFRDAAMRALASVLEGTREDEQHPEVRMCLPHVRAVTGFEVAGDRWKVGTDELHLLNESGRVRIQVDRRAMEAFRVLFDACAIEVVGRYTHCVALNGLVVAHQFAGDYTEAMVLVRRLIGVLGEEYGDESPEMLVALHNLAILQDLKGEVAEAYSTQVRVYRGRRRSKSLGRTHRDTVSAWNNLASFRGKLDDPPGHPRADYHRRVAHRMWAMACFRWSKVARPHDRDALDARAGLALSYRALGRLERAASILDEVYRIRTDFLGADHPDTMDTVENMLIIAEEIDERT